jgi:ABC-type molybdenum transport system ATPase subunit/photorepair protein PhrA
MSGQNRVAKRFDAKLQEAEQRIMLIKRALMKSVTVVDEERSAVEQYQNDK